MNIDEEDLERDYLKDQIYLWEKEYEAQNELMIELQIDDMQARKPAIIQIVINKEEYAKASVDNDRTNNPSERKFHSRKQGKKH